MLRLAVDRKLYLLRNAVERSFNKLKEARRGATSYLKTSESFLGFTDFTSIHFWLRHLGSHPVGTACQNGQLRGKARA